MFRRLLAAAWMRPWSALGAAAFVLLGSCAQNGGLSPLSSSGPGQTLKRHVAVLASDELEGRGTGTEGFAKAADYVSAEFAKAGLVPAQGTYRQAVPLYSVDPASVTGSLQLTVSGSLRDLELNEDVSFFAPLGGLSSGEPITATGDLVFVGHGIAAPLLGLDDYEGVDVEGKIAVILTGTPTITDSSARLHFQRLDTKRMLAVSRGAVGVIFAEPNPRSVSRLTRLLRHGPNGPLMVETPADETVPVAALSNSLLLELLASTGADGDAIVEAVRDGEPRSMDLNAQASLSVSASAEPVDAFNIVGVLPGQDPELIDEAVVVTAHLDHLGRRHPGFLARRDSENADEIFNGALDNALGVSIIMDVAQRLSHKGGALRTVIFVALTAEEAGLLGSDHLAATIDDFGYRVVANVNIDMPIMTYPFTDVIGFGVQFSSLESLLDAAAAEVGVRATPDPMPSMALFVRSDHYRFVQRGVPSVFLFNGVSDDGREGFDAFMAQHYHRPSDEVGLPIRWQDAARFTDLSESLVRRIADAPEAPTWNEGAVFAP